MKSPTKFVLAIGALLALIAGVAVAGGSIPASWRCSPQQLGASPSAPLAGVRNPARLRVIVPCLTVSGVVRRIRTARDGDWHVDLAVDMPYRSLLTSRNRGRLVVEVVPADQPGCAAGLPPSEQHQDPGGCTGRNIVQPAVGAHIAVSGPFVFDTHHGWTEIHPAWRFRALR